MARVAQEQYEEQLAETEAAMVKLRSSYRVETTLARKFSVNARTVRKWMKAVRERWKKASLDVDKDTHRNEIAATLNEVIFQAMNKSFIVKNDDGTVVVDTNPNSPTFGKPVVKANPDLQRVLHGISQLRSLHGVDAPIKLGVKIDADVNAMPDIQKIIAESPEAEGHLRALLKTMAPNGDLTQLAGEWFVDETPETPGEG